jgi:uncharacterized membrane protein YeaQ/YmgE (transglycosylase-associated protein family)
MSAIELSPAAYFLAFILATLYGAAFHLWQGGAARWLLLYLLSGWVGFAVGHIVGGLVGFTLFSVGTLHVLPATLGSAIALFTARWLAQRDAEAKE